MTTAPLPLRFVQAGALRFAYLEEGEGPLVLLVHGFPDTAHSWDAVRPALAAAGFRAVSPFTRGYHPTQVPADGRYDAEALGQDLVALIDALGEERAILVGHDWGAIAATAAANLRPQRVQRLVTVALPYLSSLLPLPRILWGVRHVLRLALPGGEAWARANDFAYVDELVRRWSPAWAVPAEETRAVKECFRRPESLAAAVGYYRALRPWPHALLRGEISVPAVAFSGADDGIARRSDYERAARWYRAGCEIVHMPGGHFLHREHPERFIQELLRVLRGAKEG